MTIRQWLDDFGYAAVIRLAKKLEGQRIYIPGEGPLPPALASVLGASAELLQEYRGERIEIPRLKSVVGELMRSRAREEAKKMLQKGLSERFISRVTGLSRPSIAKLRAR